MGMQPAQRHDRGPIVVVDRAGLRQALRIAIGRRRGKLLRPPPDRPPRRIEATYYLELSRAIDELRGVVRAELIPKIGDLALAAPAEVRAQDGSEIRRDVFSEKIETAIQPIRVQFTRIVQGRVGRSALKAANDASVENAKTQRRAMETVFGIRPELAEPWLTPVIDSFVRSNARLVTNVGTNFIDALEQRVGDGVRQGLRAEDIAKGVASDFVSKEGVAPQQAKRRAALIARDQVGSFYGDLTRVRQTRLGIERYRWRTVKDERVRCSHREREGEIFEWGKPIEPQLEAKRLTVDPIDGPPGRPIQCRCVAEPVVEDLVGEEGALGEPTAEEPAAATEIEPNAGATLLEPEPSEESTPIATPAQAVSIAPIAPLRPPPISAARSLGIVKPPPKSPAQSQSAPTIGASVVPTVRSNPAQPTPAEESRRRTFADGRILSETPLGGGANTSLKVRIRDPETGAEWDAVLKPASGEAPLRRAIKAGSYYKRESAAYEVDQLLGGKQIVPTTVVRDDAKLGPGSVQHFVDGEILARSASKLKKVGRDVMADEPSVRRMWLLDVLLANSDRHSRNALVRQAPTRAGYEVVPIDNGLTLPKSAAIDRFIFPASIGGAGTKLSVLDRESHDLLKSLDLRALGQTLQKAGIEKNAARAALVRARTLQIQNDAVDRELWAGADSDKKAERFIIHSFGRGLLPDREHDAVDHLVDEIYAKKKGGP